MKAWLACALLLTGCNDRSLSGHDDPPGVPGTGTPPRTTADPSARFFWSYEEGFTGAGGGVEILGDGTVHGWFSSLHHTDGTPDFSDTLPLDEVATLFNTFDAVDLSALPHKIGGAECDATGLVRDCEGCIERKLDYEETVQVTPELDPVFAWFTQYAKESSVTVDSFSPATMCKF
jgi:hypothetical protein